MVLANEIAVADAKLARAKALNKAMVTLGLEREGLARISTADLALLRGASLVELSDAGRMVKAFQDVQPAGADGSRTFSMVCDDRLVAAIYTFLHFTLPPASSPYDEDYLILKMTDSTHTYFLISGAREASRDDDEEEAEAA